MNNAKYKQVYIMRKDLGMRQGKMCSQAAHAMSYSVKSFKDKNLWEEWEKEGQTKITLRVDSLEEYIKIKKECEELKIPFFEVKDMGFTEFKGKETITCAAIGPWPVSDIDKVTGGLKLL